MLLTRVPREKDTAGLLRVELPQSRVAFREEGLESARQSGPGRVAVTVAILRSPFCSACAPCLAPTCGRLTDSSIRPPQRFGKTGARASHVIHRSGAGVRSELRSGPGEATLVRWAATAYAGTWLLLCLGRVESGDITPTHLGPSAASARARRASLTMSSGSRRPGSAREARNRGCALRTISERPRCSSPLTCPSPDQG